MTTINSSIDNVRRHLLKPREQSPNVDTVFGAILDEMRNFTNELTNSNVAWDVREYEVSLGGFDGEYLVGDGIGKILFCTANNNAYPYSTLVDFVDLSDASTNWWTYETGTASRPEDWGYWAGYPGQVAFVRKGGSLYAKMAPNSGGINLKITAAAGDWAENVDLRSSAVLSEYHHLPEIRAAMNVLADAEWSDDAGKDEMKRKNLMATLPVQENRVYEQFRIAKRSLTADAVVFRETMDDYF